MAKTINHINDKYYLEKIQKSFLLTIWTQPSGYERMTYDPEFSSFNGHFDFDNILKKDQKFTFADHGQGKPIERRIIQVLQSHINSQRNCQEETSTEHAMSKLDSISINYYKYDRQTLLKCSEQLFDNLDIIDSIGVCRDKLKKFLHKVCCRYNQVPFHNFTHAFNVTHVCYWVVSQQSGFIKSKLSKIQLFTLLISCIGHDLNHPGIGPSYYTKLNHSIAQTVNNQSVFEHFHCYTLMRILDETSLLDCFTAQEQAQIKTMMQSVIMSTDMAGHNLLMSELDSLLNSKTNDDLNPDQIILIMKVLVHTCDISNPSLAFEDFREQGLRVCQEFDDQFVAEKSLVEVKKKEGIEISNPLPFFEYTNYDTFCRFQINFTSK